MVVSDWQEELRLIINTVEIVGPDPERVYARLHELISEVIDQERESVRGQSWPCCHLDHTD